MAEDRGQKCLMAIARGKRTGFPPEPAGMTTLKEDVLSSAIRPLSFETDTVLAFDFGLKRVGVAVGNTLLRRAQALTVISAASNRGKFEAIAALILEWQVKHCVVGLPFYPDGNEHAMTVRCRRFAHQLEGRFGVTTSLVDERYSSTVIEAKRGEVVDAQAAALILQQYFDEH